VLEQEIRAKAYHGNHQEYGHDHADMFTCIADRQVLVVSGMGKPAHEAALAHGLKVIPTNPRDISAVIASYLDGTLEENPSLIHTPGAH
jgi:predicted Fe-Mo cluster-binding NifX family protein